MPHAPPRPAPPAQTRLFCCPPARPPAGSYRSAYAANLAAGLDDSDGPGPSGRGRGGSSLASRRSASLHLKGLPLDREEGDIYRMLQGFEGIRSVRVLRDKVTGASRGLAFVVRGRGRASCGWGVRCGPCAARCAAPRGGSRQRRHLAHAPARAPSPHLPTSPPCARTLSRRRPLPR